MAGSPCAFLFAKRKREVFVVKHVIFAALVSAALIGLAGMWGFRPLDDTGEGSGYLPRAACGAATVMFSPRRRGRVCRRWGKLTPPANSSC